MQKRRSDSLSEISNHVKHSKGWLQVELRQMCRLSLEKSKVTYLHVIQPVLAFGKHALNFLLSRSFGMDNWTNNG